MTHIFDAHDAQYAKNANGMLDRQCQYDRPFTRGHMMHIIDAHEVLDTTYLMHVTHMTLLIDTPDAYDKNILRMHLVYLHISTGTI